jgi:hypothetical protein
LQLDLPLLLIPLHGGRCINGGPVLSQEEVRFIVAAHAHLVGVSEMPDIYFSVNFRQSLSDCLDGHFYQHTKSTSSGKHQHLDEFIHGEHA